MEYLQYEEREPLYGITMYVLNLIINGIPSIHINYPVGADGALVLNLIINGIPSILGLEFSS